MTVTINASTSSGLITTADTSGVLALQTAGTTALTIDASQNVGIGTASPSSSISVSRTSGVTEIRLTNTGSASSDKYTALFQGSSSTPLATWDESGVLEATSTGGLYIGAYNGPIRFNTGVTVRTERARIDSSGNLLINTTAFPNGTSAYGAGFAPISFGRSRLSMACSSTSSLELVQFFNPNGQVGNIATSGSATSYVTSSDYRLKENIAPMTGALTKVAALKPVTYKWKVDGENGEGFIAHELAEVAPQCVTGEKDAVDEDGKPVYQGIDTSFLVATLTAAIQEQQAIIESLTQRITALEGAQA